MNYIDYGIVVLYLAVMVWLGFKFQKSKESKDYFLGGKQFGWFSLCMSTMATQLSAVSFISAPAFVGLRTGGGMQWLTFEFGVPLAMIFIMTIIGPALYRSGVVSAYAFLEKRFNTTSRLLISAVFLISRCFATGVTIYAVGLVLSSIIGIAFWQTMLILGVITILYSLEGGMKAVVYSEVAQMIIKVLGIITIMICGLYYIGGWDVFVQHVDRSRLNVVDFSNFGLNGKEYGFWPMLIGGFFLYSSYYGTDQTQAQRILSAKDETTVRKLLLFNGLFRFPVTLSYCFGGLIIGTFVALNADFASRIPAEKPDLMIPVFITNYLPHGIVGIIVIAIIAAGMSSYSSTLNSLSAVTMEDFITRKWNLQKERYVFWSKSIAFFWGVITMILAFFVGGLAKTIIEAINKIGSMFYGPILAIFLLAIIGKGIKATAANIGLVTGVLVNLILWLFFKNVFWFWWNAIGVLVTMSIGTGLSLLLKNEEGNTTPVKDKSSFFTSQTFILLLFFLCIITFSILLPQFF
ncbi:MAG: sodium/solute symporter [Flavisolibacter sp.]|nr:sodium/solute symporter [Flavisolibacter sp.]